jgi:DNA-binding LacI/PurR family transcriptional regulator
MAKGVDRTLAAGDPRRKYASSTDVARLAGVSQSAVSRTFTAGASISAKTRQKVIDAAAELGYQPSVIPKILLTQRSSLIAIVSGGLWNPFYAGVVELFAREIQKTGNNVLFFSVDHGEYIDEIIPTVLGYRVDGIISALSIVSSEAADSCAKMNIPVVLFNGKLRNDWVGSVCSDNVAGGRDVADLFLSRGARRFAAIAGKKGNMASEDRLAGYLGRLGAAGMRDFRIVHGDFRFEGGHRAALELMADPADRPDAIFCASDLMALGAMEAIRHVLKLRVPEDVMVAGFDDIPAAAWPSHGLTTVRQDGPRMVAEALKLLDRMIGSPDRQGGLLHVIPAPLVERESTRRP